MILAIASREIFFDLRYWIDILMHHKLDVMHVEKIICKSLLETWLNLPNKARDNTILVKIWKSYASSRLFLRRKIEMGSLFYLLPLYNESWGRKKKKVKKLCTVLKELKVPNEFHRIYLILLTLKIVGYHSSKVMALTYC